VGAKTDKIFGRAKQAVAAITGGNKKMKHKGQTQEDKGELKGSFGSTVDKSQDALEDVTETVDRIRKKSSATLAFVLGVASAPAHGIQRTQP